MKLGKFPRIMFLGAAIALSGCDKPSLENKVIDARTPQNEEIASLGDVPSAYYFPAGDTDKIGLPDPTYGSVYPMGDDDRATWEYMSRVYSNRGFFRKR